MRVPSIRITSKVALVKMIGQVCGEVERMPNTLLLPRHHVELMLETAAAESALRLRRQVGGGPARGLWQVEPGMSGAMDTFVNYLDFQPGLRRLVTKLWLGVEIEEPFLPTVREMSVHLEKNDVFCCIMARFKYRRDPRPIPDTISQRAAYWKMVYNTHRGQGTIDHYLEAAEACDCAGLIDQALWKGKK